MTRLTKDVREAMVTDLLRRRFEAEGKALAARSGELFMLVYEDIYDTETRRLMTQIMKRVDDPFMHTKSLDLNLAGFHLCIGDVAIGGEKIVFRPEITPRPILHNSRNRFATYSDCPIAEKLNAFATDIVQFLKDIRQSKTEALGALSTVTTAKQLSEMWPEAMPVIGHRIPMPSGSNVPSVQFSKLTKAFGLDPASIGEAA